MSIQTHQAYLEDFQSYMIVKISLIDFFSPTLLPTGRFLDRYLLSKANLQALQTFADAQEGLYRLILVPSRLDLRALHYVIQRAFGFRNQYDHEFVLSSKLFRLYGGDSYEHYCPLAGLLYRYPTNLKGDEGWDRSILDKQMDQWSYFRNHYRLNKRNMMIGETFIYAQSLMEADEITPFYGATSIPWFIPWSQIGPVYQLLERLTLQELLTLSPQTLSSKEIEKWKEKINLEVLRIKTNWKNLPKITRQRLLKSADTLAYKRDQISLAQQEYKLGKKSLQEVLDLEKQASSRKEWPEMLYSAFLNPQVVPFTNHLYYRYDINDQNKSGWCFEISLIDELMVYPDQRVISRFGLPVKELYSQSALEQEKHEYPTILKASGANPMESARDLNTWIQFLKEIFSTEESLQKKLIPKSMKTPDLHHMF